MSESVNRKSLLGADYIGLSKLTEQIYLGSALEALDTSLLRDAGITAVINLTAEAFREGDKCFRLGCNDREPIPSGKLVQFFRWMDELIDAGEVLLVHCHAGISRTPAFVIAWQMHRAGANKDSDLRRMWSRFEDRIGAVRPIIKPHHELKKSVLDHFGFEYRWPE